MLHWLAGQKPVEGSDPDATGYVEPPETPAPVFAVRAFKHAIFGTPQTVASKPRRHSNTDNARPRSRTHDVRVERPGMTRPKSAGDAHGLGKHDDVHIPEPVSSPTKGILMTPGTAAAKRKTVTFGSDVEDNEEKNPIRTGLPDDCPGKFPSPFTKPGASDESPEEQRSDKLRARSKLTQALEEARDESARKHFRGHRREKSGDDNDPTTGFSDPMSQSGQYWKAQYDSYRENSQREVKKLITKQVAAKSFAKHKDVQCTELTDELRQEKKKVERLEKRCGELEAQLKTMHEQIARANAGERKREAVAAQPELTAMRCYRTTDKPTTEPAQVPQLAPKVEEPTKQEGETARPRNKSRPESLRTKTNDDIWNQSLNASNMPNTSMQNPIKSPSTGRTVTSGTDLTPLRSLTINTLPIGKLARRDSAQPSPPNDRFAKEPLVRQEVPRSPQAESKGQDSAVSSRGPWQPSPQLAQEAWRAMQQSPTHRKATVTDGTEELSTPAAASSPLNPSPLLSPPGVDAKKSSYLDREPAASAYRPESPTRNTSEMEEAVQAQPRQSEKVKPTAAWNAINGPMAGKRVSSLTAKDGTQVSMDRIEAAKARMAARGRVVS